MRNSCGPLFRRINPDSELLRLVTSGRMGLSDVGLVSAEPCPVPTAKTLGEQSSTGHVRLIQKKANRLGRCGNR